MTGLFMIVHAAICIFLATIILMQSGRGGGLTEGFASAESMFGAKTSAFLIKITTVLCTLFFVTSLALAIISSKSGRSLMENQPIPGAPQPNAQPSLDDLLKLEQEANQEQNSAENKPKSELPPQ